MEARELHEHFRSVGTWVNREKTCDRFLFGSPDTEVKGIAVSWIPTNAVLDEAGRAGLNLFVTHEPAFYHGYDGERTRAELVSKKEEIMRRHGTALLRCHDTWDRMPEVGIPDAWAAFLGFETEPRPVESYYRTCLLDGVTVEEAGRLVLDRVKALGQDTVLVLGDRRRKVSRMAVGTGAITRLPRMHELRPDVILATDDGINHWDGGLWALDTDVPLLIVNHATAEKPGMMAMARYLSERYAGLPVRYFDVPYPPSRVDRS